MFDSVLGRGQAPRGRFGVGTVLSIGLHGALLVGAVFISSRPHAPHTAEPDYTIRFAALRPPPPPPAPLAKHASTTRTEAHPKPKSNRVAQPIDVATAPPEPTPPEQVDTGSTEPDPPGATPDGDPDGVPGGETVVGTQVGPPPAPVASGSEVLPFGEGMTRPEQVEGRDPVYTREALEARVEGTMLVHCVITAEGRLERCRIDGR